MSGWLITPQLTYDGFDQADIHRRSRVRERWRSRRRSSAELDEIAKPGRDSGLEHVDARY